MKSLLPLIAIGLIGGCCAADKFKLPPFRLFDKNNDGTFEAKEVGPLMIDAAKVVTQVTGKKLFKLAGMAIPEMRDGKLTKEEYKEIEDSIRTQATAYLKELREHAPEVKSKIEVMEWLMRVNSLLIMNFWLRSQSEARKYLAIATSYAEKYLQEALDGMQDLQPAFEVLEIVRH